MSNDPVRLTFPDGTELFTMGDSWSVQCGRLFDTEEKAQEAYNNYWGNVADITSEELEQARKSEESVEIHTQYASRDESGNWVWKEMLTPNCKASKQFKIITEGPYYNNNPCDDYC